MSPDLAVALARRRPLFQTAAFQKRIFSETLPDGNRRLLQIFLLFPLRPRRLFRRPNGIDIAKQVGLQRQCRTFRFAFGQQPVNRKV